MDVKTEFLNGYLDEEIYMALPEGFKDNKDTKYVYKLNKSLYGLKQASKCWNEIFHTYITKLGFQRSDNDYCLYINTQSDEGLSYLILYVDDILIASKHLYEVNNIKDNLKKEFDMTDGGELNFFLGIHIKRNHDTLEIDQIQYLKNVLKKFNMEDSHPISTPMEHKLNLVYDKNDEICDKPYKQLIGCLMYAMLGTRPDLCHAVSYFRRYQSHPTEQHWIHLKRVLSYIKGSLNHKLCYKKSINMPQVLSVYVDADWGNDINDCRSTTGYLIKLYGCTISWYSRKQQTVAILSTESEYMAVSDAICEVLWIRSLISFLNLNVSEPTLLYEDNQSCIKFSIKP